MSRIMTGDLLDQFKRAISMIRFTVEEFDDEQWLSGISWFQTPARVGYHLVETLDFYFSGKRDGQEFTYGHRFGGPWRATMLMPCGTRCTIRGPCPCYRRIMVTRGRTGRRASPCIAPCHRIAIS